jgi:hypothetical protein
MAIWTAGCASGRAQSRVLVLDHIIEVNKRNREITMHNTSMKEIKNEASYIYICVCGCAEVLLII